MTQDPHIVATWSETGKVHLWDIRAHLALLEAAEAAATGAGGGIAAPIAKGYGPLLSFSGHKTEGFAMDWSPVNAGQLVTGDCSGAIHVWPVDGAAAGKALGIGAGAGSAAAATAAGSGSSIWKPEAIQSSLYTGHTDSCEDLQWSPTEGTVFASCSVDKSIRIWDTRSKAKGGMLSVQDAHTQDVNVISWSKLVSFLLVSGSDDGSFKVWDLRNFKAGSPISHFRWHKKPITSIEWAPDDENVLAVASEDDTVTLWDMSLEEDEEAELALVAKKAAAAGLPLPAAGGAGAAAGGAAAGGAAAGAAAGGKSVLPSSQDPRLSDIPPQLLFVHAGQESVREVHFHRQMPGLMISTAADGFNFYKPDVQVTT